MAFELPDHALSESFIASSGPGGQNVNKVATAVQLRLNVFAIGLSPDVYQRLKTLAGRRLTAGGELVLTARAHRTQEANRSAARARMTALVEKAHEAPAKRAKTRLNRVGKTKRLEGKKSRATVKKNRGRVRLD